MKRRCVMLLTAALVLAQPIGAYAAGSPSTKPGVSGGGGGSVSSSKGGEYKPMTSGDAASLSGANGAVGGTMVIGNTVVKLSADTASMAGLTEKTVEAINAINAGTTALYRVIGTTNVVGYSALAPVQVLSAADVTTGQAASAPISLNMYVPNLIQGLGDIQVLYYNKDNIAWELVAPAAIDYATKQVTVNVADGTPFTIVYKK